METLLRAFRAIAEPTRMRILALCARAELTVSELMEILEQSQPRVSRHLRLMVAAGLLERHQEGTWAWHRLAGPCGITGGTATGGGADGGGATGEPGELGQPEGPQAVAGLASRLLPADDPTLAADRARLARIRARRAARAEAYFARHAAGWDSLRTLHMDGARVEAALLAAFAGRPLRRFLDIGTGTGRVLALVGRRARAAVGVDTSPQMLAIARTLLDRPGLEHCQARRADMYALPWAAGHFDGACLHMALHYAEDPAAALREAARTLAPGGRLVVADLAPHTMESLRTEHAHLWPGFSDSRMRAWMARAGLAPGGTTTLPGTPLTARVWTADRLDNDSGEDRDNGEGPRAS